MEKGNRRGAGFNSSGNKYRTVWMIPAALNPDPITTAAPLADETPSTGCLEFCRFKSVNANCRLFSFEIHDVGLPESPYHLVWWREAFFDAVDSYENVATLIQIFWCEKCHFAFPCWWRQYT